MQVLLPTPHKDARPVATVIGEIRSRDELKGLGPELDKLVAVGFSSMGVLLDALDDPIAVQHFNWSPQLVLTLKRVFLTRTGSPRKRKDSKASNRSKGSGHRQGRKVSGGSRGRGGTGGRKGKF